MIYMESTGVEVSFGRYLSKILIGKHKGKTEWKRTEDVKACVEQCLILRKGL